MDQKITRAAWRILCRFDALMDRTPQCAWTKQHLDQAKQQAISHHANFVVKHSIQQNHLDVNKLLAWYAFFWIRIGSSIGLGKERFLPLHIAICEMNVHLEHSYTANGAIVGLGMRKECLSELRRMAQKDSLDDEFAIGKNGMYTAFRTANEVKAMVQQRIFEGSLNLAS